MKPFALLFKLAQQAKRISKPNPAVAAVIIKNNKLIGQGFTQSFGGKHAEVEAVESVKNPKLLKNSEMWVTLSPCHFQGKTPACTKLIVRTGIKSVHIALKDPHEKVNLLAHKFLVEQGISVKNDFPEKEKWKHFQLNYDYLKKTMIGTPALTLKYAMTLDGKMADGEFKSKWISNEKARLDVQKQRQKNDAIVVGANTLLQDNPNLNVRLKNNFFEPLIISWFAATNIEKLKKIIENLKVMENNSPLLLILPNTLKNKKNKIDIPFRENKKIDFIFYKKGEQFIFTKKFLQEISKKYLLNSLYVEGGAKTHSLFFNHGLVDRLEIYLGNKIVNDGRKALSPFSNPAKEIQKIELADNLERVEFQTLGDNVKISGFLKSSPWLKIWQEVNDF